MSTVKETIRLLEEISANAWPAEQARSLGGWWLRFTHGYSRRANSVWPNAWWGPAGLEERLAQVETFYHARGLPPRYQICDAREPGHLDQVLQERGYTTEGRSCVQVAALATALARVAEGSKPGVEIHPDPSPEWLSVYLPRSKVGEREAQACARIFSRITPATAYATLRLEGEPAAVGLGVVERGWLGIYCMATLPAFRRRGGAQAVLASLLGWGQSCGAEHAYLQVLEENEPARALYERLSFETFYCYHYRSGAPG